MTTPFGRYLSLQKEIRTPSLCTKIIPDGEHFYTYDKQRVLTKGNFVTGEIVDILVRKAFFLALLPQNRALYLERDGAIGVVDLKTNTFIKGLASLPLEVSRLQVVANEHFCLVSYGNNNSCSDLHFFSSRKCDELYHCLLPKVIYSLAIYEKKLFIGTFDGELYVKRLNYFDSHFELGKPSQVYNYALKRLFVTDKDLFINTSKGTLRFSHEGNRDILGLSEVEKVCNPFGGATAVRGKHLFYAKEKKIILFELDSSSEASQNRETEQMALGLAYSPNFEKERPQESHDGSPYVPAPARPNSGESWLSDCSVQ